MEDATEEEKKIAINMIIVALWCTQIEPSDCPSMKKVVGDNLNPTCSSIHLGESSHSTQF